jgi:hypothetical protein
MTHPFEPPVAVERRKYAHSHDVLRSDGAGRSGEKPPDDFVSLAFGFHSAQALIGMLFLVAKGIELRPPLPARA